MSEVRTIAVIGAGTMGRSIAQAAASGGFRTILEDILPTALRKAEDSIRAELGHAVASGHVKQSEADATFGRIEFASNVEDAARDADMVIEAVPDELESKLEIFVLLDKLCRPDTILVANTQTQSITELASVIYRAPQCIAMRFPRPPQDSVLLEILRGLETSDDTASTAVAVARRMKKEPVLLRETPGAIVARLQALLSNEAFRMVEEGLATPGEIDRAIRQGLGVAVGPLAEAEQTGLERRLLQLEYLHKTLGPTYRPSRLLADLVRKNKKAAGENG